MTAGKKRTDKSIIAKNLLSDKTCQNCGHVMLSVKPVCLKSAYPLITDVDDPTAFMRFFTIKNTIKFPTNNTCEKWTQEPIAARMVIEALKRESLKEHSKDEKDKGRKKPTSRKVVRHVHVPSKDSRVRQRTRSSNKTPKSKDV